MTNHDPIIELIVAEEKQRLNQQNTEQKQNKETNTTNNEGDKEKEDSDESGRVVPDFDDDEDDDEIIFIEERDVTLQTGVWNKPAADDTLSDLQNVPIEVSGHLDDFLVVADSTEYSVKVEVDDHNIVDDTFNFLRSYSDELSKISAYDTLDDDFVVAVGDYEFDERFNVEIKPNSEDVTFTIIRVEIERK